VITTAQIRPQPRSRPNRLHRIIGTLVAAGLVTVTQCQSIQAAETIRLRYETMTIEVKVKELEDWSTNKAGSNQEITPWIRLLSKRIETRLKDSLHKPIGVDQQRFFAKLLDSWLGDSLKRDLNRITSNPENQKETGFAGTFQVLLKANQPFSPIQAIKRHPEATLNIDLEIALNILKIWTTRIRDRIEALKRIRAYSLPISDKLNENKGNVASNFVDSIAAPKPLLMVMLVSKHRKEAIPLELWTSTRVDVKPWILLSPGLGGGSYEFRRIAATLADQGWPVIIASHPGSNDTSIREFLLDDTELPSAHTLKERVQDIDSIVEAVRSQRLPPLGKNFIGNEPVILMGHSLGAVGSLLYAGAQTTARLSDRCRTATDPYPLTNISILLQCHDPESLEALLSQVSTSQNNHESAGSIAAVIALNPFGSLFWPEANLASLSIPVLMVGGTFDLLTPPLEEQVTIFPAGGHPKNRLAIIEGGSHFYRAAGDGEYLLAINEELRGNNALQIQEVIASITTDFLESISNRTAFGGRRLIRDQIKVHQVNGRQLRELKMYFNMKP